MERFNPQEIFQWGSNINVFACLIILVVIFFYFLTFPPSLAFCNEFHWVIYSHWFVETDDKSPASYGKLKEPNNVGIVEQSVDAKIEADYEASDTDEEHCLDVGGQPSIEASTYARFICLMWFWWPFFYYIITQYFI